MKSVWMKLRSSLRAFCAARGGNVAITFAFATIPIIAGVGFAVDYSKANQVKVAMQAALDSTALMISKEAAKDTSDQLQTNATNYFNALFKPRLASGATITVNYTNQGGTQIVINGAATVATSFLGLIGINTMTVSSSSTVKWGTTRLRVALVLDNTGSMADSSKIDALKTATHNLLTQLQNAASVNGDVYVSIIPFVKDVNLGPSEWNSDWIYWGTAGTQDAASPNETDNTSWDANNGTCQDQGGTILGTSSSYKTRSSCRTKSSCSISGYTSQNSCTNAGSCSLSGYTTESSCTGAGSCSLSGYTDENSCTNAGSCSMSGVTSQNKCGTCSNSQYTSRRNCTNNNGTWSPATWTAGQWTATPGTWTGGIWSTASTKWVPADHNTWNGCVMDRGYPASPSYLTVSGSNKSGADTINNFDTNVVQPDPVTPKWSSLYAAEQYDSCPQAAMGLSYDWTTMNQLVTNMSPAGNTNQAIGLQLGWMSLVGGGPFIAPAKDPNYTYTDVIILLTDGMNTQNRWTSTQSSIDAREQLTCNNINAAGVTLYTIQVNTGNDPTSSLLQNCAGSPGTYPDSSKFFLLKSADAIVTTFNQIGTKLSNLYVAR